MAKTSKNIQEKTFTVDAAGLSLGRLGVQCIRKADFLEYTNSSKHTFDSIHQLLSILRIKLLN